MKAALYLWRRRLRWVAVVSVLLAVAMGIYTYYIVPVRYEAVAELLMVQSDEQSQDALAAEVIRWSLYDDAKGNELTDEQWNNTDCTVSQYRSSNILLVKAKSTDAELAAQAANVMAETLLTIVNTATGDTVLKLVVEAGVPESSITFYREKFIAAVFFGSLLLLALVTLLWRIRKPKLIRSSDIAQRAEQPVLAEIPSLRGVISAFTRFDASESPMLLDFASYYTQEQLRLVSLAIRHMAKETKLQSLAVVSRSDDEFRSEILVMLAQELARQGSRVLAVDMNWYKPRVGELLRANGEHDLVHCLVSNISMDQAIVQTDMRNLYFLDQKHSQSMAAQLSASMSFASFMDALYEKFDFVIFDMPDASLFSDALALSGTLHAYLPVIKSGEWTADQIGQWMDAMNKLKRKSPGMIVSNHVGKRDRKHEKLD